MLTREEVLKIAKLARLALTDTEVEDNQKKLDRVLEHIHELAAVQAPPGAGNGTFVRHVPKDSVAFRGDSALPFANTRALLDNAPAEEANCFLLPTTVEHT